MELIKDRLQKALIERNMSASELAKASGIDKGAISRYLQGKVIPKQSKIEALSKALKVAPAWLMGFDPEDLPASVPEPVLNIEDLNEANRIRLFAYYQALKDSQKDGE